MMRVIVQLPETAGHGCQLFQTPVWCHCLKKVKSRPGVLLLPVIRLLRAQNNHCCIATVLFGPCVLSRSPVTKVTLSVKYLVSVCPEYNNVYRVLSDPSLLCRSPMTKVTLSEKYLGSVCSE
jgi:hypothetical protein